MHAERQQHKHLLARSGAIMSTIEWIRDAVTLRIPTTPPSHRPSQPLFRPNFAEAEKNFIY
jgi:hypothetical protein